jgi:hypothetical protein
MTTEYPEGVATEEKRRKKVGGIKHRPTMTLKPPRYSDLLTAAWQIALQQLALLLLLFCGHRRLSQL